MSAQNDQAFTLWWQEFIRLARANDLPIVGDDPAAYRSYFNDGYSPHDAVAEEVSYGD